MRVAIVVLRLGLTAGATEDGIKHDIEHALSRTGGVQNWPQGHFYYAEPGCPGVTAMNPTRVTRVFILDIPEGT